MQYQRRDFLKFLGTSSLVGSLSLTPGCRWLNQKDQSKQFSGLDLNLSPSFTDQLETISSLSYEVLIRWDDAISSKEKFGINNDFLAFLELESKTEALLWVNHEYPDSLFLTGVIDPAKKSKENFERERQSVGGTLLRISKESGTWKPVINHPLNRRLDATTKIPLIADRAIEGSFEALGTFANCAGGKTPWGTVLSCEENYDDYFGESIYEAGEKKRTPSAYGWERFDDRPPEHYGWVVEIHPMTGEAKKLTSLGRFAHESATLIRAKDGRCVVYSGDDKADECLYKFISKSSDSLEEGELFVANLEKGEWRSLDFSKVDLLKKHFKDQTEVLIRCREAARLVGGTPLDRPEDVEIDPLTGNVFVALTNNSKNGNFHGSILKIEENNGDHLSQKFTPSTYAVGGEASSFSCPDNLLFDSKGNLWVTTDISAKAVGRHPYSAFGNNALFFVPRTGPAAGRFLRVVNAPVGAELTGPCLSSDEQTLFLCVQHPGEKSPSLNSLTSHWPDGGDSLPRSAVVSLEGEFLKSFL